MRERRIFTAERADVAARDGRSILASGPVWPAVTLVASLLLDVFLKHSYWFPDLVALTLVFWTMRQPPKAGMLVAFAFGVLVDVQQGSIMGQHALAYVILSYLTGKSRKTLSWFRPAGQAIRILPMLLCAQALVLAIRAVCLHALPDWGLLGGSLVAAAIWPAWSAILGLPFRRARGIRDDGA